MSPETALPLQPPSAYEANRDIVFMTLPLLALSTYFYGARPAVLCLTAAFTAMLCDHLVAWLRHRPCDKTENSSIPSISEVYGCTDTTSSPKLRACAPNSS